MHLLQRLQAVEQMRALYSLPIYRLPPELVLNILDHIEMAELPKAIGALYHLLAHHGIVAQLPRRELKWTTGLLAWPMHLISTIPFFSCRGAFHLPIELSLGIQQYLSAQDKVNYVLAIYKIRSNG